MKLPERFESFDWETSSAHIFFLSRFLHPHALNDFMKDEGWETVLKETPKKALGRFIDEGLIQPSGLHGKLDYRFKLPELKEMLKMRNMKVSGNKDALIERLFEADASGMERFVQDLEVFECTKIGRERSKIYLDEEKEKRTIVEQQVFQALQDAELDRACQIANAYHQQEVFSTGINCDPVFIKEIYSVKPKILKNINDHQLGTLRIIAGMMHLLYCRKIKEWLPSDFHLDLGMSPESAARMLIFNAYFLKNLSQMKQSGNRNVRVLVVDDACDYCKQLKDKNYDINKVPELPYEKCTYQTGCRCVVVASPIDSDEFFERLQAKKEAILREDELRQSSGRSGWNESEKHDKQEKTSWKKWLGL